MTHKLCGRFFLRTRGNVTILRTDARRRVLLGYENNGLAEPRRLGSYESMISTMD